MNVHVWYALELKTSQKKCPSIGLLYVCIYVRTLDRCVSRPDPQ